MTIASTGSYRYSNYPGWLDERKRFKVEIDFDPCLHSLVPTQHPLPFTVFSAKALLYAAAFGGRHRVLEKDIGSEEKRFINEWRINSALGFLSYDEDGFLCRSPLIDELEASEKTSVAYAMGSMLANAIAYHLLGAWAVVHVSTLDHHFPGWLVYNKASQKRPDYIAVDIYGQCFVIEAKGRRVLDSRTKKGLRSGSQTSSIARFSQQRYVPAPLHVKGVRPVARIGVATIYGSKKLKVFGTDPEPDMILRITPAEIIELHYRETLERARDTIFRSADGAIRGMEELELRVPDKLLSTADEMGHLVLDWRAVPDFEQAPADLFVLRQFILTSAYQTGLSEAQIDRLQGQGASPRLPLDQEIFEFARKHLGDHFREILNRVFRENSRQPDGTYFD